MKKLIAAALVGTMVLNMPDAFIGVDVIVGTRGETPEYFEQAYQFIDGLDVTQLDRKSVV